MRDALMRLLEPPIEALGYELVDLEVGREGRGGIVRISSTGVRRIRGRGFPWTIAPA